MDHDSAKIASFTDFTDSSEYKFQKEAIASPIKCVYLTTHYGSISSSLETRCIFSQGPWLESSIIQTCTASPYEESSTSSSDESVKEPNYDSTSTQYRHLVFDTGGSIHGIRKVHSCQWDDDNSLSHTEKKQPQLWIAFGGRKISILGGGLTRPFQSFSFHHYSDHNRSKDIVPFLTLSDWIWDVRPILLLDDDSHKATYDTQNGSCGGPILLAIGLAHNSVDLWLVGPIQKKNMKALSDSSPCLSAIRLRKVVCEVRCITLCIHFCGWDVEDNPNNTVTKNEYESSSSSYSPMDLSLRVMVGTVSNQILIWNVLHADEGRDLIQDAIHMYKAFLCSDPPIIPWESDLFMTGMKEQVKTRLQPVQYTLSGHDGVIFSCKTIRLGNYRYIATVSDDRTLRLWNSLISDDDKEYPYQLVWTGYGHSARIWDCAFISWVYHEIPLNCVLTCGEDNTIRLWNMDDGQVLSIMKGHQCQSIWKICVNEWFDPRGLHSKGPVRPLVLSGANDGTVKCWDLAYHIYQYAFDNQNVVSKESAIKNQVSKQTRRVYKLESEDSALWSINGNEKMIVSLCGMKFFPKTPGNLLVATKDGRLRTLNFYSGVWTHHHPWAYPTHKVSMSDPNLGDMPCSTGRESGEVSLQEFADPSHGCCISIHSLENMSVIGTAKGEIIISSLVSSEEESIHVFSAKRYNSIHSLDWVDRNTLISLHVKGVAIFWSFEENARSISDVYDNSPQIVRVLMINIPGVSVGIPMCFVHDCLNSLIFLGDSRGNIAVFNVAKDMEQSYSTDCLPAAVAPFAHAKEHVRDLALCNPDTLFSVGNDGLIHICTYFKDGTKVILFKAFSVPVSNLTALSNIWVESRADGHRQIVVAGFFGNEFSMWDASSSYRLLNVPIGSRQRSYDLHVDMQSSFSSTKHQLAICVADGKDDPGGELEFYYRDQWSQEDPFTHSLGSICHGETVLDIAVLSADNNQQIFTGSNDGSLKVSTYTSGAIREVIDLAKFETCIRSLCCSKHSGSNSALLVVCGGKNVITFYAWKEQCPYFLCQNRRHSKSQDHRINSVKALPLFCPGDANFYHLVVTGDSNGMLSLFVASEKLGQPRRIDGEKLRRSTIEYGSVDEYSLHIIDGSHPILDLDMIRVTDNAIIVGVGDTIGSVQLWLLPGTLCHETKSFMGDLASYRPFYEYSAHLMGTNAVKIITTECLKIGSSSYAVKLMIISGGDDQVLSIMYITAVIDAGGNTGPSVISVQRDHKDVVDGASGSAIKGLYISEHYLTRNKWLVYTVGYEEILTLWEIDALERKVTYRSSSSVDVSDVECLDGFHRNGRDVLVVGGQGIEVCTRTTSHHP